MDWSYEQDEYQQPSYDQEQTNELFDYQWKNPYDEMMEDYELQEQMRRQSQQWQRQQMRRQLEYLQQFQEMQKQLDNYYEKMQRKLLNEQQKQYLRDVYEQAQIKYYKQQFKFDKLVREIVPYRTYINGRQLFEVLEKEFAKLNYGLCEITVKSYVKDYSNKQQKFQEKLNRIQRQISNILKKDCYKQYTLMQNESSYKAIPIAQMGHQYVHFTLKIPYTENYALKNLQKNSFIPVINGKAVYLKAEDTKFRNKDYLNVSNNSYCNKLKSWDIGCRLRSQKHQFFYPYFEPSGQRYMTFSRSMQKEQESSIRQICIYNSFDTSIVLRTVIKKEQIYLLSYSQDKKDIYIFLSSPPTYQFSVIPPNTYCLPNYLNNWERVQNFLFLKHRSFKDNDFLRLFLYSNSYMHIELDNNDKESCKNIQIDIDLIQMQLNCKKEFVSKDIQVSKTMPKALEALNAQYIKQTLSFINIADRPQQTQHTKWKLSYQIMLLIRFNVIGPSDLQDFLKLTEANKQRLQQILQYLSRRSTGYTNKVAGINRSKTNTYQKLKTKITDFLKQSKNLEEGQQKKDYFKYSCLIYKVSLTPSGILPNPVSHETKCRLIRQYEDRTQFFLKVTLLDDAGETMKNQRYIYNKIMRKLIDKVTLLGKAYVPLGWSGSQLRASSLWYVNEILNDQQNLKKMTQQSILAFLGDFSKISIPAKKAARIGQAFSSSYCYDSSEVKDIIEKDDFSARGFPFTDGIGKISKDLFEAICEQFKKINIHFSCCLQIRYKGAKGVLLLNQQLQKNTMILRESMVKYECNDSASKKYLDILSWDKYLSGYLNKQIIILLKSLQISDQVFLQFQRKYVVALNKLNFQELDGNLLKIFNDIDQSEDSFLLTIKNLKDHFKLQEDLFFQQFLQSVKENKFAQLKKKTRILIQKSARLIGVIDDYSILQQGELYCCIKKSSRQQDKAEVIQGYAIITRNPSLSPADVRKCRCLSEEQVNQRIKKRGYPSNYFAKFMNCIVFPKKGLIPLTAQISGSDLDGDIFFICWDQNLVIKYPQPCQTLDDPNKKANNYYGQSGYKEMLDFFVNFANNQKLGRINNIHTVIADKSNVFANDKGCKRLAAIHGKAVDYAKSGQAPEEIPQDLIVRQYPDFMQKWNKATYESTSILGKLYRQCKSEIVKRKKNQAKIKLVFQKDLIKDIAFSSIKVGNVIQVIEQLRRYEEAVTQLMNSSNLKTQFELYTGSSAESDELRNQFGRKRLADWLKELRNEQQFIFFRKKQKLCKHYAKLKSNKLKKKDLFEKPIIQKAILCYVISYLCYCLKENKATLKDIPEEMIDFCKKVKILQQQHGYEGKYLGFIWVVIPKIIINAKFTMKK